MSVMVSPRTPPEAVTSKSRTNTSEPHEIAPLFEVHDHDHEEGEEVDHEHPEGPQLGEVARLDTCVTVIDQVLLEIFLSNMGLIVQCQAKLKV